MNKRKLLFFAILLVLLTACSPKEQRTTERFEPQGVPPGSESTYRLSVTMDENSIFTANAEISVENVSEENWTDLVFYFIPNVFTEQNAPSLEQPATVDFEKVAVEDTETSFSLVGDTLTIPLEEPLVPGQKVNVSFDYQFTLPENGIRFTQSESGYYLAQWYPMVPTYRDGWNKIDYDSDGESYHTHFSDFELTVTVPDAYVAITSGVDNYESGGSHTLSVADVKEVFVAILEEPNSVYEDVNNTMLSVHGVDGQERVHSEVMEYAIDAFTYFENTIGPYPLGQLDIILDEIGMEYPGAVTAGHIDGSGDATGEALIELVVHEMAHQWFYGIISNDPADDPWIDEGLATMSEYLYAFHLQEEAPYFDELKTWYMNLPLPVNRPSDAYHDEEWAQYIYGKSSAELGALLQEKGGLEGIEHFMSQYYEHYRYKEVDTEEFIRFLTIELELKEGELEPWLEPEN